MSDDKQVKWRVCLCTLIPPPVDSPPLQWCYAPPANRYDTFCCCKRKRKSRSGGSGSGTGVELAEVSSAKVLPADVLPSAKVQAAAHKDSFLQRFMRDTYGPFLMKTWVKVVCVLLFLCLVAGCTVGVVKATSGFRLTDVAPDDSYLRDYLDYSLKVSANP